MSRSVLVLFILALGLGLYLWLVEMPMERKRAHIETESKQLVNFKDSDVQSFTLHSATGDLEVSRSGDRLTKLRTDGVVVVRRVSEYIGSFFLLPILFLFDCKPRLGQPFPGAKRLGPIQILLAATFSRKMPIKCQEKSARSRSAGAVRETTIVNQAL